MPTLVSQLRKFFRFEGVSMEVVVVTALISYGLQINAIISGQPLYMIAFVTLLPWIPLAVFEGVWKVRNYSMVAVLGLFTVLQIGHFGEHLIQVLQIHLWDGTVACPPPVDNAENALRAIERGWREITLDPTFASVDKIVQPAHMREFDINDDLAPIVGPAACAVFGQLDLELVHLIWELIGYFGTAFVLFYFPRNIWLYIAFLCLSWHALEHVTITYFYYFDQAENWWGLEHLWATIPGEGKTFVAVPVEMIGTSQNFYEAGGKFGLMANNGLFEKLTGFDGMPSRPELHMGYNFAITLFTVIGFLVEVRRLRSRYLESVFGDLSKDQIAALSQRVEDVHFDANAVIMQEGEPAADCFLIKEGKVGIYLGFGSKDLRLIAEVGSGQLIGEMGLLDSAPRSATVIALTPIQALRIDARLFAEIVDRIQTGVGSEDTLKQLRRIAEQRREFNGVEIS